MIVRLRLVRMIPLSAPSLAILGDYVPFGVAQALGQFVTGSSLDNTLRVCTLVPTDWVLIDVRVHAIANGFGHGRVELTKFHTPPAIRAEPEDAPANALGMRRIMFAVDDVDDVVTRLRKHGGELVGEIAQYEDLYRLCFLRGPEGIIIGLAEQLS